MSVARRPLLTATAAGTLLGALWFVPSANATGEEPAAQHPRQDVSRQLAAAPVSAAGAAGAAGATGATGGTSSEGRAGQELRLADTGAGADTAPYVLGGSAFLAVGVGLVAYATRRGAGAVL
ncbi:hypothetical protein AB0A99_04040 [Streptomyces fradiae]|uniref:hypothetical protein n=1 Tax=Streptomyces fradiae TaxID=1906 RepID=UPI0033FAB002